MSREQNERSIIIYRLSRGASAADLYSSVFFFLIGNSLRPKIYQARTAGGKKQAHHKYKKNIAMTDCLQAGYSITRQSVIAFLFVLMVSPVFFPPTVWALYILGFSLQYQPICIFSYCCRKNGPCRPF